MIPMVAAPFDGAALPMIADERPSDVRDREALLDAAFGPGRFAKTCQRLRRGRRPADGLALVARRGPTLVGTLRLWHVTAGDVPALLLGPLAVSAEARRFGLGARLMEEALSRAVQMGHAAVLLVGDPGYYARFGFSRAPVDALALPGPVELHRFLGRELRPSALAAARGLVRAADGCTPAAGRSDFAAAA